MSKDRTRQISLIPGSGWRVCFVWKDGYEVDDLIGWVLYETDLGDGEFTHGVLPAYYDRSNEYCPMETYGHGRDTVMSGEEPLILGPSVRDDHIPLMVDEHRKQQARCAEIASEAMERKQK